MSHEPQQIPGEEVDPLSMAAGGIDTTIPLLTPDRVYRLECSSCKVQTTKSDESRNTLAIVLKTTKDATFVGGKPARAGYKLYKYYGVTETPARVENGKEIQARTNKEIARDLALVLKAFYGAETKVTPRELLSNPAMLEGRPVDAKVNVEKGTGGFPDKNGFSLVIPA